MTIDAGPAVTGDMLDNGKYATAEQPLAYGSTEASDTVPLASVSSVADHRIGSPNGKIEDRQAIDGNAEASEVVSHKSRGEPGRRRCLRIRQGSEAGGRWVEAPMRRAEPRDAAALLVDKDRRIITTDTFAQRGDQLTDLIGRAAVAPEQDEADWSGGRKEIAFESVQALAGTTQNNRARRLIGQ
jgi:hypothetical protein